MIVLVTGGREFKDRAFVFAILDQVHARRPITTLVEGGATGADVHARAWAISRNVTPDTHEANWQRYGHHAGRVRNCSMLRETRPKLVIAFPGGKGTRHMRGIAKEASVVVFDTARFYRGEAPKF